MPKPKGKTLKKKHWKVETIPLSECRTLVEKYHYAGAGSNTATFRHGLIHRTTGIVYGAAWWLPPMVNAARLWFPEDPRAVLVLSRLVCRPEAPKNAASFLISQSIKLIRQQGRWKYLLTYADEGYQKHTGTIYKATNWEYLGKTTPEPQWVDARGHMVSRKAGPRARTKQEMEDAGFTLLGRFAKHRFGLKL